METYNTHETRKKMSLGGESHQEDLTPKPFYNLRFSSSIGFRKTQGQTRNPSTITSPKDAVTYSEDLKNAYDLKSSRKSVNSLFRGKSYGYRNII